MKGRVGARASLLPSRGRVVHTRLQIRRSARMMSPTAPSTWCLPRAKTKERTGARELAPMCHEPGVGRADRGRWIRPDRRSGYDSYNTRETRLTKFPDGVSDVIHEVRRWRGCTRSAVRAVRKLDMRAPEVSHPNVPPFFFFFWLTDAEDADRGGGMTCRQSHAPGPRATLRCFLGVCTSVDVFSSHPNRLCCCIAA